MNIYVAAKTLHQFLQQPAMDVTGHNHHSPVAIVFGCNDISVARHAANCWKKSRCDTLLMSGGLGRLSQNSFTEPEAETFSVTAQQLGVPETAILKEPHSTNTQENVQNSLALLGQNRLHPATVLLICKPVMCQRVLATFEHINSFMKATVSCPPENLTSPADTESFTHHCHMLVGEIQRLQHYPARGFHRTVEIPKTVKSAYEILVAAGYTRYKIT